MMNGTAVVCLELSVQALSEYGGTVMHLTSQKLEVALGSGIAAREDHEFERAKVTAWLNTQASTPSHPVADATAP